jgi:hypothetical protein
MSLLHQLRYLRSKTAALSKRRSHTAQIPKVDYPFLLDSYVRNASKQKTQRISAETNKIKLLPAGRFAVPSNPVNTSQSETLTQGATVPSDTGSADKMLNAGIESVSSKIICHSDRNPNRLFNTCKATTYGSNFASVVQTFTGKNNFIFLPIKYQFLLVRMVLIRFSFHFTRSRCILDSYQ